VGIYCAPRDRQGQVLGTGGHPPRLDYRRDFWDFWRAFHVPEHRISELWRRQQAEEARGNGRGN